MKGRSLNKRDIYRIRRRDPQQPVIVERKREVEARGQGGEITSFRPWPFLYRKRGEQE